MLFSERYKQSVPELSDNHCENVICYPATFQSIYDSLILSLKNKNYQDYQHGLTTIFKNHEYKSDFETNILPFVQNLFQTENRDFIAYFMQNPYCETSHDYFGLMVLAFNQPQFIHEDIFDTLLERTLESSEKEYYPSIIKSSTVITHLPVFQWYNSRHLLDTLTYPDIEIIAMGAITQDNTSFLANFTLKYEKLSSYILTTLVRKEKIDSSIVQNVYDCLIQLLPDLSENTIKELIDTHNHLSNKEVQGAGETNTQNTFVRHQVLDKFSHDFERFLLSRKLQEELQDKKEQPRMKI